MKRRHIVSIFATLALAVGSSALLTGCAGKSYYFKAVEQPDGTVSYEMVGEITSKVEGQSSVASTASTDTTSSAVSETPVSAKSKPNKTAPPSAIAAFVATWIRGYADSAISAAIIPLTTPVSSATLRRAFFVALLEYTYIIYIPTRIRLTVSR